MAIITKNDIDKISSHLKIFASQKIIGMPFEGATVGRVENISGPLENIQECIIEAQTTRDIITLSTIYFFARCWSTLTDGNTRSLNIQIQINGPIKLKYDNDRNAYILQNEDQLVIFLNNGLF